MNSINALPHRTRSGPGRCGMSMIELLAAAVLASLLMVAVLGILLTMSAQRRAFRATDSVAPWREQLLAQLRWDFMNARKMSWSAGELRLYGLGGRDFVTASVTQRPCEVVYSIRRMMGKNWLLRSEIDVYSRSNRNVREELVCFGVERFDFRLLDRDEGVPQRTINVPRTFRMILHGETRNRPVIEQAVLLN